MNLCGLCRLNEGLDQLCPGCALSTSERLGRMPRLYDALAAFLQPGGRRPEMGRSRPVEAPLSVSEPVVSLRGPGGIVGVLEDWRSAMQAERGWGQPAVTGTTEQRVAAAARGLSLNLDWIASSWDMAGQCAAEIRALEVDVLAVVHPRDPAERPQRLGPCPEVLDESGTVCGAVLLRRPGQSLVQCSWCGAAWLPAQWHIVRLAQLTAYPVPPRQPRPEPLVLGSCSELLAAPPGPPVVCGGTLRPLPGELARCSRCGVIRPEPRAANTTKINAR